MLLLFTLYLLIVWAETGFYFVRCTNCLFDAMSLYRANVSCTANGSYYNLKLEESIIDLNMLMGSLLPYDTDRSISNFRGVRLYLTLFVT